MSQHAIYHRRGWKPKRLVVAKRDKDAGTVDLADEAGALIVTSLPLVDAGKVPESGSWATLEGVTVDLPTGPEEHAAAKAAEEEAAKKAADEAAAKQLADEEAAKKAADEAAAKKGGKS